MTQQKKSQDQHPQQASMPKAQSDKQQQQQGTQRSQQGSAPGRSGNFAGTQTGKSDRGSQQR